MNVNEYLQRIKGEAYTQVSLENLKRLHKNHLYYLTYENLDIMYGRHISLSVEKAYEKLIQKHRGGFCFELNLLFGWLLKQLGYKLKLIGCRVFMQTVSEYNRWLAHIAWLVDLPGDASSSSTRYLVDVGCTVTFQHPLEFCLEKIQKDMTVLMKITPAENCTDDSCFTVWRCDKKIINSDQSCDASDWIPAYQFDVRERELSELQPLLDWVQTRECPRFFNRSICLRYETDSVIMLVGYRFSRLTYENCALVKREDETVDKQRVMEIIKNDFFIKLDEDFEPRDWK
jgi:N-hydroxyarylamine O-acetyltransferase